MSERTVLWYKVNGLARVALARSFGLLPSQTVVNEYPKCGGTWLCQMLEALTGIRYPRLRLPGLGSNLLHGHYLRPTGISRAVVVWRDPRDVLVSHFHHCLHFKPMTSDRNTRRVRGLVGLDDAEPVVFERDFPRYYELISTRRIHPYFTIGDFYANWFGVDRHIHTSYERLQADTEGEILGIATRLLGREPDAARARSAIEMYDFSRVSGRAKGQEKPADYLRKGIVGDWKNHLVGDAGERVADDLRAEIAAFESSELAFERPS